MSDIIYRINEWHSRNVRRDEKVVETSKQARLAKEAYIESIPTAPIVYGFAGVTASPVHIEVMNSSRKTTGIDTDNLYNNSALNRDVFGRFLSAASSGTSYLMLLQSVFAVGNIEGPIAVFINKEPLGFDGWGGNTGNKSKWRYSCHHFNVGLEKAATELAAAYSPKRNLTDKFTGLAVVTGLYYRSDYFEQKVPEVYLIVEGPRIPQVLRSSGTLGRSLDSNLQSHGLYGALIDYITSSRGMGLPSTILDFESWTNPRRDGILATQYLDQSQNRVRIRNASYETDSANPKSDASLTMSPLPPNANWPCWGQIDTSRSFGDILTEFSKACPPLKLFTRLNGQLACNVTSLYRRANYEVVATITDSDIVEVDTLSEDNITNIRFNNYALDFASDTLGEPNSTRTINCELCGSVSHAQKIKQEYSSQDLLDTVNMTLTRRWIALEPGDVIRVVSSVIDGLVYVNDVGMDESFQIIVTGKLLTITGSTGEEFEFIEQGFHGIREDTDISLNIKIPKTTIPDNLTYTVSNLPTGLTFDAANLRITGKF